MSENEQDNATIRKMRDDLDKAREAHQKLADELKAAQTQAEQAAEEAENLRREKLGDVERLSRERDEAHKKAGEFAKYKDLYDGADSKFKALYEERLASAPEEHRGTLQELSARENWQASFDSLNAAIKLIPAAPVSAGTGPNGAGAPVAVTPPTGGGTTAPNLSLSDQAGMSWENAAKASSKAS